MVCFLLACRTLPYTDAFEAAVQYKEVQIARHAASSRSRRRHYQGTIIIPDSEGEDGDKEEDDEEEGEIREPPSKKPKVTA